MSQPNTGSESDVSEKKKKTELIFNFFDTDNSGNIDQNELSSIFSKVKTYDRNNNSEIEEDEAQMFIDAEEGLKDLLHLC